MMAYNWLVFVQLYMHTQPSVCLQVRLKTAHTDSKQKQTNFHSNHMYIVNYDSVVMHIVFLTKL